MCKIISLVHLFTGSLIIDMLFNLCFSATNACHLMPIVNGVNNLGVPLTGHSPRYCTAQGLRKQQGDCRSKQPETQYLQLTLSTPGGSSLTWHSPRHNTAKGLRLPSKTLYCSIVQFAIETNMLITDTYSLERIQRYRTMHGLSRLRRRSGALSVRMLRYWSRLMASIIMSLRRGLLVAQNISWLISSPLYSIVSSFKL